MDSDRVCPVCCCILSTKTLCQLSAWSCCKGLIVLEWMAAPLPAPVNFGWLMDSISSLLIIFQIYLMLCHLFLDAKVSGGLMSVTSSTLCLPNWLLNGSQQK